MDDDAYDLNFPVSVTEPVLPAIIIIGFNDYEGDPLIQNIKEILVRSFQNIFHVEFIDQYVPRAGNVKNQVSAMRNHRVPEQWMHKMRYESPSILIDFRYLTTGDENDFTQSDLTLAEHIFATKSGIPTEGPKYVLWLGCLGKLSNVRRDSILKQAQLDKSAFTIFDLTESMKEVGEALKNAAKSIFEISRNNFYRDLGRKYKRFIATKESKFETAWMAAIYYYFKLAVIEEFRVDLESALKYYHSILAKFKVLIEDEKNQARKSDLIGSLRDVADICFIRTSYILYRLNQAMEADRGLSRYLDYFSQGLRIGSVSGWKYKIIRYYARQLQSSLIWNPGGLQTNMQGSAYYLMRGILQARELSKTGRQCCEQVIEDIGLALEGCVQGKLDRLKDVLLLLLVDEYFSCDAVNYAEPYLNQLLEEKDLEGWSAVHGHLYECSLISTRKLNGSYQKVGELTWTGASKPVKESFENNLMEAAFRTHQLSNDSIRLYFPEMMNRLVYCTISFAKKSAHVDDYVNVFVSFFNASPIPLIPDSIGIFFSDPRYEPLALPVTPNDEFTPGSEKFFLTGFVATVPVTELSISYVTVQMKNPQICLQFGAEALLWEGHEVVRNEMWRLAKSRSLLKYFQKCSNVYQKDRMIKIEPIIPSVKLNVNTSQVLDLVLTEVKIQINFSLTNESTHAVKADLLIDTADGIVVFSDAELTEPVKRLSIPRIQGNQSYEGQLFIMCKREGAFDLAFKAVCSFEIESIPIGETVKFNFDQLTISDIISLESINPFQIEMNPVISDVYQSEAGDLGYEMTSYFSFEELKLPIVLKDVMLINEQNGRVYYPENNGTESQFVFKANNSVLSFFGLREEHCRSARMKLQASWRPCAWESKPFIDGSWPFKLAFQPTTLFVYSKINNDCRAGDEVPITWTLWNYSTHTCSGVFGVEGTEGVIYGGPKQKFFKLAVGESTELSGVLIPMDHGIHAHPSLRIVDLNGQEMTFEGNPRGPLRVFPLPWSPIRIEKDGTLLQD